MMRLVIGKARGKWGMPFYVLRTQQTVEALIPKEGLAPDGWQHVKTSRQRYVAYLGAEKKITKKKKVEVLARHPELAWELNRLIEAGKLVETD